MFHFSPVHLLAGTCVLISAGVLTRKVTTCNSDSVHRLSCDTGVIYVQTVLLGREDNGRCFDGQPPNPVTHKGCSAMGTEEDLKTRCNGKKVCEHTSVHFTDPGPWTGTFRYLHTTYICIPAKYLVTCEDSLAYLQCDKGQVIYVYGADYGRRDRTTCTSNRPYPQIQKTDCSNPSSKVAESCNGKNSCIIKASNSVFGDPCVGTYKYLEVAFTCQNAVNPRETPSKAPSQSPSEPPSQSSSESPSQSPSQSPSEPPSQSPSQSPSEPLSQSPSESPSEPLSQSPSESPSQSPSQSPSEPPSQIPSESK